MAENGSGWDLLSSNSDKYYNKIRDGLRYWFGMIRLDSQQNIYCMNTFAEAFFREFLNRLFDWDLRSANTEEHNAPGIDLIGTDKRIVVQVSSKYTHDKIQKSMDRMDVPEECRFCFVAITPKVGNYRGFRVPENVTFDPSADIYDIDRLLTLSKDAGIVKMRQLSELVDEYIGRIPVEPAKPAGTNSVDVVDAHGFFEDKWYGDAFLTEGVPLKDIYCPPECCLNGVKKRLTLSEVEYQLRAGKRRILLIQGQPGIGKSTLVSQFVCNYAGGRQIIVFRCQATGVEDWNDSNIYRAILSPSGLKGQNLTNCILILDGLDEIAGRESLDTVFANLIKSYNNSVPRERAAYLVITCRENYIKGLETTGSYNYITLCPFNEKQIPEFCKCYSQAAGKDISKEAVTALRKNEKVYGIPLICYMVLALGIEVQTSSSIVDVYDQIFDPENGGIYGRFYNDQIVPGDPDLWEKLHRLSQDMALWIFNNNFEGEEIPKATLDDFAEKRGLDHQMGLDYFRKLRHSEGSNDTVVFVHRSMIEYFTADAVARIICPNRGKITDNPTQAVWEISRMLYWQKLDSGECLKYLSKMLEAGFIELDNKREEYLRWESAVFQQLKNGVPIWGAPELDGCDYADRLRAGAAGCQSLIRILDLIRGLCKESEKIGSYSRWQIGDDCYKKLLLSYILSNPTAEWFLGNCDLHDMKLSRANLWGADLHNAYLMDTDLHSAVLGLADFSAADLRGANLRSSVLINAKLAAAKLCDAGLCGADLCGADLCGADLCGADLCGADLHSAKLQRAKLNDAILNRKTAADAIQRLKAAQFHTIKVWDDQMVNCTTYTREEFFAEFDN